MKSAAVLLVFVLTAQGFAQESSLIGAPGEDHVDRSDDEARALFNAGEIAFSDGRFQDALDRFREAYALSNRPELLFNIGSAADRLRDDDAALDAFRRFLHESPEAENRDYVEERIRILEEATSDLDEEPSTAGPLALIITGAVVVVAGGALLGVAIADRHAVENATSGPWSDFEDRAARVGPLSGVGIGALAVGAALLIGGIVWKRTSSDRSLSFGVGANSMRIEGSF